MKLGLPAYVNAQPAVLLRNLGSKSDVCQLRSITGLAVQAGVRRANMHEWDSWASFSLQRRRDLVCTEQIRLDSFKGDRLLPSPAALFDILEDKYMVVEGT